MGERRNPLVTAFLLLRAMQGKELRHRLCFSQRICVHMRIGNAFVGNEGDYFL